MSNAAVWYLDDFFLRAHEGDTGALIYNGARPAANGAHQFTAPIAVKGAFC